MCVALHDWVVADEFPAWAEVKSMLPELRSLWHHRNNLFRRRQWHVVAEEEFPERPVTVVGPEGWQRTTFSVLSCIIIRRSFGTDADAGAVGRSFLLDGYGG